MNLIHLYAIGILLLIGSLMGFIRTAKKYTKLKGIILTITTLLSCITMVGTFAMQTIASNRGFSNFSMPVSKVITSIMNSPKADKFPEDPSGSILILYKFGCPDCEAVYDDLKEAVEGHDVYWIPTTDPNFVTLKEQYGDKTHLKDGKPTIDVPAGIYIHKDPEKMNGRTGTLYTLYHTDIDGTVHLDESALTRLFKLQNEEW